MYISLLSDFARFKVAEGGAAALSGCVKSGDVIVSVDGKNVEGMQCR